MLLYGHIPSIRPKQDVLTKLLMIFITLSAFFSTNTHQRRITLKTFPCNSVIYDSKSYLPIEPALLCTSSNSVECRAVYNLGLLLQDSYEPALLSAFRDSNASYTSHIRLRSTRGPLGSPHFLLPTTW
jgi:hypothetical protein